MTDPTRYSCFIPVAILTSLILTMSAVTGCTTKPTGPTEPPASWQQQLVVAQQAAQKRDPNAILMQVDAGPIPSISHTATGNYGILYTEFRFARAPSNADGSAEQIRVTMDDTAPSDSVNVESGSTYNWLPLNPTQRQAVLQNIANVQISAADAYTRTISLARAQAARYRGNVYPTLSLILDNQRAQIMGAPPDVAAVWLIHYTPVDGQGMPVQGATTLRIYVDPRSGAILDQHEGPP